MLWRGIEIEPQWVILALLLVAVALGRGREFLRDWTPFLLLFLGYEVMRGFAARTGFAPHDISGMERALFQGAIPTLDLQARFYRPDVISAQDWVAMAIYFLHFALPVVVGFIFWVQDRAHYWRFVTALLLLSFVAFVFYLFYPSTPPWLQDHQVHKVINETVAKWRVQYLVLGVYALLQNFNPNAYAAFPSLHAAYPALATIYALGRHRLLGILLGVYTLAVWLAIVYLGEHYLVDALAGLALALLATAVVEGGVLRRVRLRRAAVTPARPSS